MILDLARACHPGGRPCQQLASLLFIAAVVGIEHVLSWHAGCIKSKIKGVGSIKSNDKKGDDSYDGKY